MIRDQRLRDLVAQYAPDLLELSDEELGRVMDVQIAEQLVRLCNPVPGHQGVRAFIPHDGPDYLEIAGIFAEALGTGAVGKYLDALPRDRKVIVSMVVNERLAGMLERRGFVCRMRYIIEIGEWAQVYVRRANSWDGPDALVDDATAIAETGG